MCLLEEVLSWDEHGIRCSASSHRSLHNPLRAYGRLGAACGIEYAAQAMAIHGALLSAMDAGDAQAGYLVSVRSTQLYVSRLDIMTADLIVETSCITRSDNNVLYQFTVSAADQLLLEGRAAVVLDAAKLPTIEGSVT